MRTATRTAVKDFISVICKQKHIKLIGIDELYDTIRYVGMIYRTLVSSTEKKMARRCEVPMADEPVDQRLFLSFAFA